MISLEKWMILTPLQILPKNVGDLGKFIVAKCFEWLPKVQKIAQSGHTDFVSRLVHTDLFSIRKKVYLLDRLSHANLARLT